MSINWKYIFLLLSAILFVACGEDRTYEYEALTQHNIWIYGQMKDSYLWADKLVEQEWKDYFAAPNAYLSKLKSKGDKDSWSYVDVDTIKIDNHQRGYFYHGDSYGMDYVLIQDPTQTSTKNYLRILTVFDDSPASRARLSRNDFIETIDGAKVTSSNIELLKYGRSRTLQIRKLYVDDEGLTYYWGEPETVRLEASEYVEDKQFFAVNAFNYNGARYAYLMCNSLLESEVTKSHEPKDYKSELDNIMNKFRNLNVNEFVLDLRLCNYGTMEMACRLASYLVSDADLNKVFARTTWNESLSANNQTLSFDNTLQGKTLSLKRVRIITSSYTQGAAEWLINGLCSVLGPENVIIVGKKTKGQNVMTKYVGDFESYIHLYPSVAYVSADDGDYNKYSGGFTPNIEADEQQYVTLGEYGTLNEVLLYTAVNAIE